MSGIDSWERGFEKRPWWTTLRAVIGLVVIGLVVVAIVGLATTGSVFFQAEAAKRTLAPRITKQNYDSRNVIQKQEMVTSATYPYSDSPLPVNAPDLTPKVGQKDISNR